MQAARHETVANLPQSGSILRYVARKIIQVNPKFNSQGLLTSLRVKELFEATKSELADAALDDMKKMGLLDEEGDLTEESLRTPRRELRKI